MKLSEQISSFLHPGRHAKALRYAMRHDTLVDMAISKKESGITDHRYCDHEIIVSLTTYGKRLYEVDATIESLMSGSARPNRIILWLEEQLKDCPLPATLLNQKRRGLQIEYCKDIRSYKKLIPTLRDYPDAAIITIDDDALYAYDLVDRLINEHLRYPREIIANRSRRICLDKDGKPKNYLLWGNVAAPYESSHLNFFTGVGGVLYPPHCLHPEVCNEEVFMDICKYADDIWFYSMALMAATKVRKCPSHHASGEDFLSNDNVQDTSLYKLNNALSGKGRCLNDIQFTAVIDRYNLWGTLVSMAEEERASGGGVVYIRIYPKKSLIVETEGIPWEEFLQIRPAQLF